jgi:hypothetical protein
MRYRQNTGAQFFLQVNSESYIEGGGNPGTHMRKYTKEIAASLAKLDDTQRQTIIKSIQSN